MRCITNERGGRAHVYFNRRTGLRFVRMITAQLPPLPSPATLNDDLHPVLDRRH